VAANGANSTTVYLTTNGQTLSCARTMKITGLTAGSNTFTLQWVGVLNRSCQVNNAGITVMALA